MALSNISVPDVKVFEYDASGNRSIVNKTFTVEVDDDFQIDGVSMPTPDKVKVDVNGMTVDAKRLPGNGEMIAPYLGTAFNVTWEYKWLNAAEYKLLYDAYVKINHINKDIFHTIKTIDMNEGDIKEFTQYTEASFGNAPYIIRKGVRYFKDVILNMTDKAGEV